METITRNEAFELYPEEHCLKAPELLREAGCSREVIQRGADQLEWELTRLLTMTLAAMAASEDTINTEMEAEG